MKPEAIEAVILTMLESGPRTMSQVAKSQPFSDIPDNDIRAAVWALMGRGLLTVGRDWEFTLVKKESTARPDWDTYFMRIAVQTATRATCDRKHVGAVFVSNDHQILATGYNGSVAGAPHCDEKGHLMVEGHCIRTVHAEANGIAQAARSGRSLKDARVYVTAFPCINCLKLLWNSGIDEILYFEDYRRSEHIHALICPVDGCDGGNDCAVHFRFHQVTP